MLVGCGAGFLNGVKIKGAHTAIKTGMLAAESVHRALSSGDEGQSELVDYEQNVKESWVYKELHQGRNFGPALVKFGTFWGAAFTFIDQNIFFGKLPFTWRNACTDHGSLKKASEATVIEYPKPDGVITFDRLSSVFLSGTNHEEDQPSHLKLKDDSIPIAYNLPNYDEPAQRYCPAGVYEVVEEGRVVSRYSASAPATACTARPATSRTRNRTSSGPSPRAAADPTTRGCSYPPVEHRRTGPRPASLLPVWLPAVRFTTVNKDPALGLPGRL
jgi:ferredoxin-like protein FixX